MESKARKRHMQSFPPEGFKGVPKETLDKLKKMYEFKAFLENWKQQWKLNITGDDGWLPPKQRGSVEKLMEQMKQEEELSNKNSDPPTK